MILILMSIIASASKQAGRQMNSHDLIFDDAMYGIHQLHITFPGQPLSTLCRIFHISTDGMEPKLSGCLADVKIPFHNPISDPSSSCPQSQTQTPLSSEGRKDLNSVVCMPLQTFPFGRVMREAATGGGAVELKITIQYRPQELDFSSSQSQSQRGLCLKSHLLLIAGVLYLIAEAEEDHGVWKS